MAVQAAAEEVRNLVEGIDQAECTGHGFAAQSLENKFLDLVVGRWVFDKDIP